MKTLNAFDGCLRVSGLAARFASCPPRFALLLDLRKTRSQPALLATVYDFKIKLKTFCAATGMACLPQRNQGGAQSAGDIRGGRCAMAIAD